LFQGVKQRLNNKNNNKIISNNYYSIIQVKHLIAVVVINSSNLRKKEIHFKVGIILEKNYKIVK